MFFKKAKEIKRLEKLIEKQDAINLDLIGQKSAFMTETKIAQKQLQRYTEQSEATIKSLQKDLDESKECCKSAVDLYNALNNNILLIKKSARSLMETQIIRVLGAFKGQLTKQKAIAIVCSVVKAINTECGFDGSEVAPQIEAHNE